MQCCVLNFVVLCTLPKDYTTMDGKERKELTELNKSHDRQASKLANAEIRGSVKGKKYRQYLETVLLSVVIVIATLVLLLPTIIYTLPLPSVSIIYFSQFRFLLFGI